MMKCPICGRKLKTTAGFITSQYTIRCECGTRVKVVPGLFKDKVVDWETPEEREKERNKFE